MHTISKTFASNMLKPHLLVSIGLWFSLQSLPSHAVDCRAVAQWQSGATYTTGQQVQQQQVLYQANWWNQNKNPQQFSNPYQEWTKRGDCDGGAPNQPPGVELSAPQAGTRFSQGTVVALSAIANDVDGRISKVEFYLDNTLLSVDTQAPFQASFAAQTLGAKQVFAKAYDDKNLSTSSAVVELWVDAVSDNQRPIVAITAPSQGAQLRAGEVILVSADARDSDGSISTVEFYHNDQLLAQRTAPPYSVSWTAVAGSQRFSVKAFDNQGAVQTSETVTVNVAAVASGHAACRPDGLYATPGLDVPYCTRYDEQGRERMGPDHPRRIIGYFTSWRHGGNGQPQYLVPNIPWQKISHINYAFAHVNAQHQIGIGNVQDPSNPATGMQWPDVIGADMDPSLPYKGHFNLLNKYKKQYPHVKTLISVGGWAETGGYFNEQGQRIASGGFYSMTTNADNSVNLAGINTFANSVVQFLRQYGFDGVDIDYEYPSSMRDSGNPDDFAISNARRAGLMASYQVLMKTLREKLDAASVQDGKHYLLTIASPSSGYLLRGMEVFAVTQYLDYVNIMSYDLHGAWNQHVGPNAALFDDGKDAELLAWNYYNSAQYQGIGYLNTDWAYHYFRGAMQAGRINIGVPYYSRGWENVQGGTAGLWGKAAARDQAKCPAGTGGSPQNLCGSGALGIDNLWHDLGKNGEEVPAGSNPLWHTKNLQAGKTPSYLTRYGLDPDRDPADRLSGVYQHHYDATLVAPWLWNAQKKVFLSIEDETSIAAKADYVIAKGIGGVMFWELAGDYSYDNARGEYGMGDDLTSIWFDKFRRATPYAATRDTRSIPSRSIDLKVAITGFKLGDQNYPINPLLQISNPSNQAIPGGAQLSFAIPTATGDNFSDQQGFGSKVVQSGRNRSGHNIGGLDNEFHYVSMTLPREGIAAGGQLEVRLNYYLPMPMPSGWRLTVGTQVFALKQEYPQLPAGVIQDGGGQSGCSGVPSPVVIYPAWPRQNHAAAGDYSRYQQKVYQAKWWTNSVPGSDESWRLVCTL